jgi:hypothetical protein
MNGFWSLSEKYRHINEVVLEATFAIQTFVGFNA